MMIGQYENQDKNNGEGGPDDIKGNDNGIFVITPQDRPLLKADETAATTDTNVVTVAQEGIKYADLYNPHDTIIMYVWFGSNPTAGSQIVLNPKTGWNGSIDNQSGLRYKSASAGGKLDYVLRG